VVAVVCCGLLSVASHLARIELSANDETVLFDGKSLEEAVEPLLRLTEDFCRLPRERI
jgi:hypothetical protein